jgi:hypothetical protein
MSPRFSGRGRLSLGTVAGVAALCVAGSVAIAIAVHVPGWERTARALPDAKDQLAAESQIFTTLIQLAGGMVVVTGLYFTAKTIYVAQEGQITDRFNKAIDHLGAEALAVRLGGVYALARIAADSPRDGPTIVEIFASFLREAATDTATRTPTDVKAILNLLGTAAWARSLVMDLKGCRFSGLMMEKLDMRNALLEDAVFRDCRLPGTRFDGASLLGTDFSDCYLRGCSFKGCDAQVANFESASLRDATFAGAKIFGARFGSASLLGADFDEATGAIRQQFNDAIVDETTHLPKFEAVNRPASNG